MTYAVPGVLAHQPTDSWSSPLRRVAIVLMALALALTFVAVQTPAPAQAGSGSEAQRVIRYAKSHLGARFRLGTEGMRYFDCSGFVYRVFKQAGLLNRVGGSRKLAAGYYHWFRKRGLVSRRNARMGDLIVWTKKGRIAHIGIAMSSTRAISALTSGVRTHRHRTLDTKFHAYLHVRLSR